MLDADAILKCLPHRYPFLLVDRVLSVEEGKAVAIKNVTVNEPFFQGHFPGKPIMPGVLVLEALAQVGGILAFQTTRDADNQLVIFLAIDNAKFRKPVIPGDQLRMEVKVLQRRDPYWRLRGEAYVDDALVCEMEFKAMIAPREAS
ncbi:MAG: 3-hydroxyacyl-ACP dehydratase FabZ [Nitrospirota bacterium]